MTITSQEVPFGGSVLKWHPVRNVHLKTLGNGWEAIGLKDYVPEPRTALACLRAAISDAYAVDDPKNERLAIRTIPKGFAVVVERPKDDKRAGDDWGEVLATVKLSKDGKVTLDPQDNRKMADIEAGMARAKEYVSGSSVTSALVDVINVWGLTLRDAGGMYWLNKEHLPAWELVCQAVISACPKTDHEGNDVSAWEFGRLDVIPNENMVYTIGADLTREVERELSRIEYDLKEVDEGKMGVRAVEHRQTKCQHLLAKVSKYAECFGKSLNELEARVVRTQVAAAQAQLAAIAKAEAEAAQGYEEVAA